MTVRSDRPFLIALQLIGGFYLVLIVLMVVAQVGFTSPGSFVEALNSPEIRFAVRLSSERDEARRAQLIQVCKAIGLEMAVAISDALSDTTDRFARRTLMEAMIAMDQRDSAAAEAFFAQIVEQDPDIDTVQQASIETDKVILDMRRERRSLDISCR